MNSQYGPLEDAVSESDSSRSPSERRDQIHDNLRAQGTDSEDFEIDDEIKRQSDRDHLHGPYN